LPPLRSGALRLVAAIEDPAIARRILDCMGPFSRAPPLTPAASSDASPGRSSEADERGDFDQTLPDDEP
jgi:hypothetical protein